MNCADPGTRVVLLGASNLTLALPAVLRHAARRSAGSGISFYVAHGPGRSYGVEAGVAGIRFTAIARSGVLEALERDQRTIGPLPTLALLTDVGNDILYRCGVGPILGWIEEIAGRLLSLGARVGITSLPVDSVETLSPWKYRLFRSLYFPSCPYSRRMVLEQVRAVQEGLERLGRREGIPILPARRIWYGFDRFHLRVRCSSAAFSFWLDEVSGWKGGPASPRAGPGGERAERGELPRRFSVQSLRVRLHRPAELMVFGRSFTGRPGGLALGPGIRLHSY
jgi:hypothetical protein